MRMEYLAQQFATQRQRTLRFEAPLESVYLDCRCIEKEQQQAVRQEKVIAKKLQALPQFLGTDWE